MCSNERFNVDTARLGGWASAFHAAPTSPTPPPRTWTQAGVDELRRRERAANRTGATSYETAPRLADRSFRKGDPTADDGHLDRVRELVRLGMTDAAAMAAGVLL